MDVSRSAPAGSPGWASVTSIGRGACWPPPSCHRSPTIPRSLAALGAAADPMQALLGLVGLVEALSEPAGGLPPGRGPARC